MTKYNYVIFTDLDGTLLDKQTFRPGLAKETLKQCQKSDIPVVFVSAKTRTEIEVLRDELANTAPFISENGGGLFLPIKQFEKPENFTRFGNYWRRQSSTAITELQTALKNAARVAKNEIRSFADMTAAEVASLTGLDLAGAKLARMREYDEPFQIVEETPARLDAIKNAITKLGYRYTHGGILHHITGQFDKGQTLLILKNLYLKKKPAAKFIGLGDSDNDLPMLQIVDYPFLVRKPDGGHNENLHVPGLKITKGIGPEGFVEAVESILN
jgi:mannosyl-3-phosphoglycerate phosphatase